MEARSLRDFSCRRPWVFTQTPLITWHAYTFPLLLFGGLSCIFSQLASRLSIPYLFHSSFFVFAYFWAKISPSFSLLIIPPDPFFYLTVSLNPFLPPFRLSSASLCVNSGCYLPVFLLISQSTFLRTRLGGPASGSLGKTSGFLPGDVPTYGLSDLGSNAHWLRGAVINRVNISLFNRAVAGRVIFLCRSLGREDTVYLEQGFSRE